MTTVVEAYQGLGEAIIAGNLIREKLSDPDALAAASQLVEAKWGDLADALPCCLVDVQLLITCLNANIGGTGDATTLAITRNVANYFGQLAAKADISADAFEIAMIEAGRFEAANPQIDAVS